MKQTRVYNLVDLKELKASERKLNTLLNKYRYVKVVSVGVDKVKILYC